MFFSLEDDDKPLRPMPKLSSASGSSRRSAKHHTSTSVSHHRGGVDGGSSSDDEGEDQFKWSGKKKTLDSTFCDGENVGNCAKYLNELLPSVLLPKITSPEDTPQCDQTRDLMNILFAAISYMQRTNDKVEEKESTIGRLEGELSYLETTKRSLSDQLAGAKSDLQSRTGKLRSVEKKYSDEKKAWSSEKESMRKTISKLEARDTQYTHTMKKNEHELERLQNRLIQATNDRKPRTGAPRSSMVVKGKVSSDMVKRTTSSGPSDEDVCAIMGARYEKRHIALEAENVRLRNGLREVHQDVLDFVSSQRGLSDVQHELERQQSAADAGEQDLSIEGLQSAMADVQGRRKDAAAAGAVRKANKEIASLRSTVEEQQKLIQMLLSGGPGGVGTGPNTSADSSGVLDDSLVWEERVALEEEKELLKAGRRALEEDQDRFTAIAHKISAQAAPSSAEEHGRMEHGDEDGRDAGVSASVLTSSRFIDDFLNMSPLPPSPGMPSAKREGVRGGRTPGHMNFTMSPARRLTFNDRKTNMM